MNSQPSRPKRPGTRKRRVSDSVPCSITIPATLQEAVIKQAEREDRTFSATVRQAIKKYLGDAA